METFEVFVLQMHRRIKMAKTNGKKLTMTKNDSDLAATALSTVESRKAEGKTG